MFDRKQIPFYTYNSNDYIYFDSAATTFMPEKVISKWVYVNSKYPFSSGRTSNNDHSLILDQMLIESRQEILRYFCSEPK